MTTRDKILDKLLQGVNCQAKARAKDFLCSDCLDRRCQKGRTCNAFLTLTDSFAIEIVASNCELN
jgi:hypothetical protein